MIPYETLILISTETTNDELTIIEKEFERLSSKAKGRIVSFDKWGKYRLSYPVNKSDYGIYVLVRYEMASAKISEMLKDLDLFFKIKCDEVVMRHVTLKIEDVLSEYQKPEAIVTSDVSNFDTFIKENKMEGIIATDVKNVQEKVVAEKLEGNVVSEKSPVTETKESSEESSVEK